MASEINDGFWRKFRESVKSVNPDAILIGEVWESAAHWLDGTMFDSTMNYDFRKHCRRFFGEQTADAGEFDSRMTDMRMRYRKQTVYAQLNLLDSHDVSRFRSLCRDEESFRLAVIFQMTFPGMPSVFYGDEVGLTGILEEEYRQPMPWDTLDESSPLFLLYFIINSTSIVESIANNKKAPVFPVLIFTGCVPAVPFLPRGKPGYPAHPPSLCGGSSAHLLRSRRPGR